MTRSRVLIVDDEDGIRDMLREFLTGAGFRVALAADAAAARQAIAGGWFDAAVVDAVLPGGGQGLDIARELARRGVPVVMMTGNPVALRQLRMLSIPALRKPFRLAELLRLVEGARLGDRIDDAEPTAIGA
jgi:two-component system, OmpR family, phosphate regulon response regulator OmpR